MRRYNACPALFMGSLRDACEKAELSYQHCPVLVYIHHDKSLLSNIFCLNVFCTEIIIDYLLENYIVWPWDITYESNRNR
jgi:FAS-associated factor 2